jgi:hypothetical protein
MPYAALNSATARSATAAPRAIGPSAHHVITPHATRSPASPLG